jgi:hypothetical protein
MRTMPIAVIALALGTSAGVLQAQTSIADAFAARPNQESRLDPSKRVQGFSLLLLLGETQGAAPLSNISAPARKALADIKDFLPYKGYRVLDTQWVAGSDTGSSNGGLRGLDNQDYQFQLRTFPRNPIAPPGTEDAALARAQFRLWATLQPGKSDVTVLLDNSFNIAASETIVVGTSRVQGDRALVVLLSAVAAAR